MLQISQLAKGALSSSGIASVWDINEKYSHLVFFILNNLAAKKQIFLKCNSDNRKIK